MSNQALTAFVELLDQAKCAACWVPHILILTAIENAENALRAELDRLPPGPEKDALVDAMLEMEARHEK